MTIPALTHSDHQALLLIEDRAARINRVLLVERGTPGGISAIADELIESLRREQEALTVKALVDRVLAQTVGGVDWRAMRRSIRAEGFGGAL